MPTDEITIPGLRPTPSRPLPFDASIRIRSFHLERPGADDLIVYATPGNRAEGATRQYLSHGHEAGVGEVADDAAVFVHAADAAQTRRAMDVRGTFDRAFTLDDDFEAIPIPGHTPGSTAYLWRTGEHRVLFTGDSLLPDADGVWQAVVLGSSDPRAYAESLDRLAQVEFDVLAPWGTPEDLGVVDVVEPDEARRRVLAARDRLR